MPLPLFGSVLRRRLEIIFEVNERLMDEARQHFPGSDALVGPLSLIDERGER